MVNQSRLIVLVLAILLSSSNQFFVQILRTNNLAQAENVSITKVHLDIRKQKKGTENELRKVLKIQQEVLFQQELLKNSKDRQAIAKHELAYQESLKKLKEIFEPVGWAGNMLKDAVAIPANYENGAWQISLTFDNNGSDLFAKITGEMAGTGLALGIFLNDKLISSPTVGSEYQGKGITGGRAVITGYFTQAAATELASLLRAGSLPK